jgi:hypothetical protein
VKRAALTILFAVVACSREPEPLPPPPPAPAVRIPLLPHGGDSHLVGATGVLEVDGPCLYLRTPNGTRILPAFAMANTRWNEGSLEVGERRFQPGQTVLLGGSPADPLRPRVPWVQPPDPTCDASIGFIAYQIVDPATSDQKKAEPTN